MLHFCWRPPMGATRSKNDHFWPGFRPTIYANTQGQNPKTYVYKLRLSMGVTRLTNGHLQPRFQGFKGFWTLGLRFPSCCSDQMP